MSLAHTKSSLLRLRLHSLLGKNLSRTYSASLPRRNDSNDGNFKPTFEGANDFGYSKDDIRFTGSVAKPTIQYCQAMPRTFSAMRHEQILQLCVEGSLEARREALTRNVMAVDGIEYDEAVKVVNQMGKDNQHLFKLEYLPYHAGMGIALTGGFASFPLIFDKDTVLWFNERFVTTEVPPVEDLQTFWEVGSWSWGWMEPMIGQVSFVLLILQFARSQAINLGLKPYGHFMLSTRGKRLVRKYKKYDPLFVQWFSESQSMYGENNSE